MRYFKIVVACFFFVFGVVGATAAVMFFTGKFNPVVIQPENIEFVETEKMSDADFMAKIVSSTPDITEKTVTLSMDKGIVRDGFLSDGNIKVPEKVEIGKEFKVEVVKTKYAELDGALWNKGGISVLNAKSSNLLIASAAPMTIKIDVPVSKINVQIFDSEGKLVTSSQIGDGEDQMSVLNLPVGAVFELRAKFFPESSKKTAFGEDREVLFEIPAAHSDFLKFYDENKKFIEVTKQTSNKYISINAYCFKTTAQELNAKEQKWDYSQKIQSMRTFGTNCESDKIFGTTIKVNSVASATIKDKILLDINKPKIVYANKGDAKLGEFNLALNISSDVAGVFVQDRIRIGGLKAFQKVGNEWKETNKLIVEANIRNESNANGILPNINFSDINKSYWNLIATETGTYKIVWTLTDEVFSAGESKPTTTTFSVAWENIVVNNIIDSNVSWEAGDPNHTLTIIDDKVADNVVFPTFNLSNLVKFANPDATFKTVRFFAYSIENIDLSTVMDCKIYSLEMLVPGSTELKKVYEIPFGSISAKNAGKFSVFFASIKTDYRGNPILDSSNNYILEATSGTIYFSINKTLNELSASVDVSNPELNKNEDAATKDFNFHIVQQTANALIVSLKSNDRAIFEREFAAGNIKLEAYVGETKTNLINFSNNYTYNEKTSTFDFIASIETLQGIEEKIVNIKVVYLPNNNISVLAKNGANIVAVKVLNGLATSIDFGINFDAAGQPIATPNSALNPVEAKITIDSAQGVATSSKLSFIFNGAIIEGTGTAPLLNVVINELALNKGYSLSSNKPDIVEIVSNTEISFKGAEVDTDVIITATTSDGSNLSTNLYLKVLAMGTVLLTQNDGTAVPTEIEMQGFKGNVFDFKNYFKAKVGTIDITNALLKFDVAIEKDSPLKNKLSFAANALTANEDFGKDTSVFVKVFTDFGYVRRIPIIIKNNMKFSIRSISDPGLENESSGGKIYANIYAENEKDIPISLTLLNDDKNINIFDVGGLTYDNPAIKSITPLASGGIKILCNPVAAKTPVDILFKKGFPDAKDPFAFEAYIRLMINPNVEVVLSEPNMGTKVNPADYENGTTVLLANGNSGLISLKRKFGTNPFDFAKMTSVTINDVPVASTVLPIKLSDYVVNGVKELKVSLFYGGSLHALSVWIKPKVDRPVGIIENMVTYGNKDYLKIVANSETKVNVGDGVSIVNPTIETFLQYDSASKTLITVPNKNYNSIITSQSIKITNKNGSITIPVIILPIEWAFVNYEVPVVKTDDILSVIEGKFDEFSGGGQPIDLSAKITYKGQKTYSISNKDGTNNVYATIANEKLTLFPVGKEKIVEIAVKCGEAGSDSFVFVYRIKITANQNIEIAYPFANGDSLSTSNDKETINFDGSEFKEFGLLTDFDKSVPNIKEKRRVVLMNGKTEADMNLSANKLIFSIYAVEVDGQVKANKDFFAEVSTAGVVKIFKRTATNSVFVKIKIATSSGAERFYNVFLNVVSPVFKTYFKRTVAEELKDVTNDNNFIVVLKSGETLPLNSFTIKQLTGNTEITVQSDLYDFFLYDNLIYSPLDPLPKDYEPTVAATIESGVLKRVETVVDVKAKLVIFDKGGLLIKSMTIDIRASVEFEGETLASFSDTTLDFNNYLHFFNAIADTNKKFDDIQKNLTINYDNTKAIGSTTVKYGITGAAVSQQIGGYKVEKANAKADGYTSTAPDYVVIDNVKYEVKKNNDGSETVDYSNKTYLVSKDEGGRRYIAVGTGNSATTYYVVERFKSTISSIKADTQPYVRVNAGVTIDLADFITINGATSVNIVEGKITINGQEVFKTFIDGTAQSTITAVSGTTYKVEIKEIKSGEIAGRFTIYCTEAPITEVTKTVSHRKNVGTITESDWLGALSKSDKTKLFDNGYLTTTDSTGLLKFKGPDANRWAQMNQYKVNTESDFMTSPYNIYLTDARKDSDIKVTASRTWTQTVTLINGRADVLFADWIKTLATDGTYPEFVTCRDAERKEPTGLNRDVFEEIEKENGINKLKTTTEYAYTITGGTLNADNTITPSTYGAITLSVQKTVKKYDWVPVTTDDKGKIVMPAHWNETPKTTTITYWKSDSNTWINVATPKEIVAAQAKIAFAGKAPAECLNYFKQLLAKRTIDGKEYSYAYTINGTTKDLIGTSSIDVSTMSYGEITLVIVRTPMETTDPVTVSVSNIPTDNIEFADWIKTVANSDGTYPNFVTCSDAAKKIPTGLNIAGYTLSIGDWTATTTTEDIPVSVFGAEESRVLTVKKGEAVFATYRIYKNLERFNKFNGAILNHISINEDILNGTYQNLQSKSNLQFYIVGNDVGTPKLAISGDQITGVWPGSCFTFEVRQLGFHIATFVVKVDEDSATAPADGEHFNDTYFTKYFTNNAVTLDPDGKITTTEGKIAAAKKALATNGIFREEYTQSAATAVEYSKNNETFVDVYKKEASKGAVEGSAESAIFKDKIQNIAHWNISWKPFGYENMTEAEKVQAMAKLNKIITITPPEAGTTPGAGATPGAETPPEAVAGFEDTGSKVDITPVSETHKVVFTIYIWDDGTRIGGATNKTPFEVKDFVINIEPNISNNPAGDVQAPNTEANPFYKQNEPDKRDFFAGETIELGVGEIFKDANNNYFKDYEFACTVLSGASALTTAPHVKPSENPKESLNGFRFLTKQVGNPTEVKVRIEIFKNYPTDSTNKIFTKFGYAKFIVQPTVKVDLSYPQAGTAANNMSNFNAEYVFVDDYKSAEKSFDLKVAAPLATANRTNVVYDPNSPIAVGEDVNTIQYSVFKDDYAQTIGKDKDNVLLNGVYYFTWGTAPAGLSETEIIFNISVGGVVFAQYKVRLKNSNVYSMAVTAQSGITDGEIEILPIDGIDGTIDATPNNDKRIKPFADGKRLSFKYMGFDISLKDAQTMFRTGVLDTDTLENYAISKQTEKEGNVPIFFKNGGQVGTYYYRTVWDYKFSPNPAITTGVKSSDVVIINDINGTYFVNAVDSGKNITINGVNHAVKTAKAGAPVQVNGADYVGEYVTIDTINYAVTKQNFTQFEVKARNSYSLFNDFGLKTLNGGNFTGDSSLALSCNSIDNEGVTKDLLSKQFCYSVMSTLNIKDWSIETLGAPNGGIVIKMEISLFDEKKKHTVFIKIAPVIDIELVQGESVLIDGNSHSVIRPEGNNSETVFYFYKGINPKVENVILKYNGIQDENVHRLNFEIVENVGTNAIVGGKNGIIRNGNDVAIKFLHNDFIDNSSVEIKISDAYGFAVTYRFVIKSKIETIVNSNNVQFFTGSDIKFKISGADPTLQDFPIEFKPATSGNGEEIVREIGSITVDAPSATVTINGNEYTIGKDSPYSLTPKTPNDETNIEAKKWIVTKGEKATDPYVLTNDNVLTIYRKIKVNGTTVTINGNTYEISKTSADGVKPEKYELKKTVGTEPDDSTNWAVASDGPNRYTLTEINKKTYTLTYSFMIGEKPAVDASGTKFMELPNSLFEGYDSYSGVLNIVFTEMSKGKTVGTIPVNVKLLQKYLISANYPGIENFIRLRQGVDVQLSDLVRFAPNPGNVGAEIGAVEYSYSITGIGGPYISRSFAPRDSISGEMKDLYVKIEHIAIGASTSVEYIQALKYKVDPKFTKAQFGDGFEMKLGKQTINDNSEKVCLFADWARDVDLFDGYGKIVGKLADNKDSFTFQISYKSAGSKVELLNDDLTNAEIDEIVFIDIKLGETKIGTIKVKFADIKFDKVKSETINVVLNSSNSVSFEEWASKVTCQSADGTTVGMLFEQCKTGMPEGYSIAVGENVEILNGKSIKPTDATKTGSIIIESNKNQIGVITLNFHTVTSLKMADLGGKVEVDGGNVPFKEWSKQIDLYEKTTDGKSQMIPHAKLNTTDYTFKVTGTASDGKTGKTFTIDKDGKISDVVIGDTLNIVVSGSSLTKSETFPFKVVASSVCGKENVNLIEINNGGIAYANWIESVKFKDKSGTVEINGTAISDSIGNYAISASAGISISETRDLSGVFVDKEFILTFWANNNNLGSITFKAIASSVSNNETNPNGMVEVSGGKTLFSDWSGLVSIKDSAVAAQGEAKLNTSSYKFYVGSEIKTAEVGSPVIVDGKNFEGRYVTINGVNYAVLTAAAAPVVTVNGVAYVGDYVTIGSTNYAVDATSGVMFHDGNIPLSIGGEVEVIIKWGINKSSIIRLYGIASRYGAINNVNVEISGGKALFSDWSGQVSAYDKNNTLEAADAAKLNTKDFKFYVSAAIKTATAADKITVGANTAFEGRYVTINGVNYAVLTAAAAPVVTVNGVAYVGDYVTIGSTNYAVDATSGVMFHDGNIPLSIGGEVEVIIKWGINKSSIIRLYGIASSIVLAGGKTSALVNLSNGGGTNYQVTYDEWKSKIELCDKDKNGFGSSGFSLDKYKIISVTRIIGETVEGTPIIEGTSTIFADLNGNISPVKYSWKFQIEIGWLFNEKNGPIKPATLDFEVDSKIVVGGNFVKVASSGTASTTFAKGVWQSWARKADGTKYTILSTDQFSVFGATIDGETNALTMTNNFAEIRIVGGEAFIYLKKEGNEIFALEPVINVPTGTSVGLYSITYEEWRKYVTVSDKGTLLTDGEILKALNDPLTEIYFYTEGDTNPVKNSLPELKTINFTKAGLNYLTIQGAINVNLIFNVQRYAKDQDKETILKSGRSLTLAQMVTILKICNLDGTILSDAEERALLEKSTITATNGAISSDKTYFWSGVGETAITFRTPNFETFVIKLNVVNFVAEKIANEDIVIKHGGTIPFNVWKSWISNGNNPLLNNLEISCTNANVDKDKNLTNVVGNLVISFLDNKTTKNEFCSVSFTILSTETAHNFVFEKRGYGPGVVEGTLGGGQSKSPTGANFTISGAGNVNMKFHIDGHQASQSDKEYLIYGQKVGIGQDIIVKVNDFNNENAGYAIVAVNTDDGTNKNYISANLGGDENLSGTIPGTMTVGKEYKITMQRSFRYWGTGNRFYITYFKNIRYIAHN